VGFETPAALKQINTQDEFNIHNIVTNELIRSYIFIAGVLFAVACFSCWIMLTDYHLGKLKWFLVYLPDPSLIIILAMIFLFSTHVTMEEFVEQLASIVVLLYSVGFALRSSKP
jgi:hypothetical protein